MMAAVTEAWSRAGGVLTVKVAVAVRAEGRGLLASGRHKLRMLGAEKGLEGQSEPDEPANVLNPNGGDHEVSWTRRTPEGNRLALAGRSGAGGGDGLMVYAWVGDVGRFRSARELGSYAGLVPSVRQSGEKQVLGGITKMGSPQLRSVLVQAGHVLLWRCQSEESAPLKAIALRVQTARARRKIAVVAAARHILRIAYYVLRDGTTYDPARLRPAPAKDEAAADTAAPTTREAPMPAA